VTRRRVLAGDRLAFAISAVFALVGLLGALLGKVEWWPGIFFAGCAASFILWHLLVDRPNVDNLAFSARGVRRTFGPRFRSKRIEAVSWDALSRVEIMTSEHDDEGHEDVSFLLYGSDDGPMAVPGTLAETYGLLEQLRRRLPDLDNERVLDAYGCGEPATRFLIWQRSAGAEATRG
jgi:hypothetical protein